LDVLWDLCEIFEEARRVPAAPTPKRILEDRGVATLRATRRLEVMEL